MATATIKFVPNSVLGGIGASDFGGRTVSYYGQVTFSNATDTYATGGLSPLANFFPKNLGPYADRTPLYAYIESSAGAAWFYLWNQPSQKLQIYGGGGSGTSAVGEVTNATALNAATPNIFTDTVLYNFCFPRV